MQQCWALKPGRVKLRNQVGPVGWLVQLPLCLRFFKKNYQHSKGINYTSCGTGIFIFKPVLGQLVFSLTFPWTGWFKNYRFWDWLQFYICFSIQGFWT
jgi:hypothetical protein